MRLRFKYCWLLMGTFDTARLKRAQINLFQVFEAKMSFDTNSLLAS
jgi:hypothetical protein